MKNSKSGSQNKRKSSNHKPENNRVSNGHLSDRGNHMPASQQAFQKLFEDGLKDIYWVEKTLTKTIPKMIKKTNNEELSQALQDHLQVTEQHVKNVEKVFSKLSKKPVAKKCAAMSGILEEGEEHMSEHEGMIRDATIIASAQKVEHYEISSYGTLCAYAKLLGMDDVANILHEILEQEEEADRTLSEIAESTVNKEALMMGEESNGK